MTSSRDSLFRQAAGFLRAFTLVTKGDHFVRLPLRQIGWNADAIRVLDTDDPYGRLKATLTEIASDFEDLRRRLEEPPSNYREAKQLYKDIRAFLQRIGALSEGILANPDSLLDHPQPWLDIGRDGISLAITGFLEASYPPFYYLTRLLAVTVSPEDMARSRIQVVRRKDNGQRVRRASPWAVMEPRRFLTLLSKPKTFFKDTYLKNGVLDLSYTSDRLFSRLNALANLLGLRSRYGIKSWMEPAFGAQVETAKHTFTLYLRDDPLVALSLNLSPEEQGNLGLVIVPTGFPAPEQELEDWILRFELTNNGPEATSFALGPNGPTALPEGAGPRLGFTAKSKGAIQVGAADATHIQADALIFTGHAEVSGSEQSYGLGAALENGRIRIEDLLTLTWGSLSLVYSSDAPDKVSIEPKGLNLTVGTESKFDLGDLNIESFQFAPPDDLQVSFGAGEISIPDRLTLGWEGLDLHWRWEERRFNLAPEGMTLKLAGDKEPVIKLGNLNLDELHFSPADPENGKPACLLLPIKDFRINRLLGLADPNLEDENDDPIEVYLRLLFDLDATGIRFREIRLDWAPETANRVLKLPGFKLRVGQVERFSLIFGGLDESGEWRGLDEIGLAATVDETHSLTFTSSFAWQRDNGSGEAERELQNDDKSDREDGPEPLPSDAFFELTLKPKGRLTVLLLDIKRVRNAPSKLPTLLQQLVTPLEKIEAGEEEIRCRPSSHAHTPLKLQSTWEVGFKSNDRINLPFLRSGNPTTGQFIRVEDIRLQTKDEGKLVLRLDLKVQIAGTLALDTSVDVFLDLSTFALKFEHTNGLTLSASKPQLTGELLGLKWIFNGAKVADDEYRYLTLATQNYDYRITQAEGCKLELEYSLLGDDPIGFEVESFQLTDAGVGLQAKVLERPSRLNGLDTRFSFSGSIIEVVDSRINGFTLTGTGPLPPALLGEGTASIALQFKPVDNVVRLISGSAVLQRNKPLECKGTGFQFRVDAIGLEFVDDGAYHLYFTLTGRAELRSTAGDDGPLALLSDVGIELVDCPITGDPSVIAEHINFLIPLQEPVTLPLLGCFQMEVRGIAFEPSSAIFGGVAAMHLIGQVSFADAGDADSDKIDLHNLYIGLPKPGSLLPRVAMDTLPLNINLGESFKLNGTLRFLGPDNPTGREGFEGEGVLTIKGLPETAASCAFVRLRRERDRSWVRAWFIYLEARQISYPIPAVQLYLREVGLGFGYRYTLASISRADRENDLGNLIKGLRELSRTQGNLAKLDAWTPDAEADNWTIALRGLFAQSSAATSPLDWQPKKEMKLANSYLFDAVVALRSDLTFLMNVRAWLNTNYHDFYSNREGLKDHPLFSGFVLVTPRQKRLLAQLASNPDGYLGSNPSLPELVQRALRNGRFAATLLIEPGLVHYELGWPNQLQWSDRIGPLDAELRGGYIMRVSRKNLVLGNSVEVRAELTIGEKVDKGFLGAEFSVTARVAYGARYIGVVPVRRPQDFAIYGAIGLEASIDLRIRAWMQFSISVRVFRKKYTRRWKKEFRLSATVDLTAAIEIGVTGAGPGIRGHGSLALPVMGHRVRISARIGLAEDRVTSARRTTEDFLKVGLEARDVRAIPGTGGSFAPGAPTPVAPLNAHRATAVAAAAPVTAVGDAGVRSSAEAEALEPAEPSSGAHASGGSVDMTVAVEEGFFAQPNYILFALRTGKKTYFALLPKGEGETGFLPPPPDRVNPSDDHHDFHLDLGEIEGVALRHWKPGLGKDDAGAWTEPLSADEEGRTSLDWLVNWKTIVESAEEMIDDDGAKPEKPDATNISLEQYVLQAFLAHETATQDGEDELAIAFSDPRRPGDIKDGGEKLIIDSRLTDPAESDYEAAVRGAEEQFRASPFFRQDEDSEYDSKLRQAFAHPSAGGSNSARNGAVPVTSPDGDPEVQQAEHLRGNIIQDMVTDLKDYVEDPEGFDTGASIVFQMGLVFEATIEDSESPWLKALEDGDSNISIRQRSEPSSSTVDGEPRSVRLFNTKETGFAVTPPRFADANTFADAGTIALTWRLTWGSSPGNAGNLSRCQRDPEHHLLHYEVRRRVLDGPPEDVGREQLITRRPADVLLRTNEGVQILKSRFALVDHFPEESPQQRAALPESGITYLYSITPIDLEGQRGIPLTRVVTRYPDTPPLVPTDAQLTARYDLSRTTYLLERSDTAPTLLLLDGLILEWTPPIPPPGRPEIRTRIIHLVFRPLCTLPLGSYGQDSATADEGVKALPAANALPLPDDIRVEIRLDDKDLHRFRAGPREGIHLPRNNELFPVDGKEWEPRAWRVFIQTEGAPRGKARGARSALVPVRLQLEVRNGTEGTEAKSAIRPVPELEWLPQHAPLAWLPPEDADVETGLVHVPMPGADGHGKLVIGYSPHPDERRGMRFHFNQGPSAATRVPLSLIAGYDLLQLDIDAHTTDTLADRVRTAEALKRIRSIEMLPPGDLPLTPGDTRLADQWEAWYPSAVTRQELQPMLASDGSPAWYSWRESMLEWPDPDAWSARGGEPDESPLAERLHPLFRDLLDALEDDGFGVDLQSTPPVQPMDRGRLLEVTAPEADPYGWGLLQRFGLSMTLSVRKHPDTTNELLTGDQVVELIRTRLEVLLASGGDHEQLSRHLHLELLYQPGRSIAYSRGDVPFDALLGIVQIGLRPAVRQYLHYGLMEIAGPAGLELLLRIDPTTEDQGARTLIVKSGGTSADGVDQGDLSREIEVPPGEGLDRIVRLPLNGRLCLLFRGSVEAIANTRIGVAIPLLGTKVCAPGEDKCIEEQEVFEKYFARSGGNPTDPVVLKGSTRPEPKERGQILAFLQGGRDRKIMEQVFQLELPTSVAEKRFEIQTFGVLERGALATCFTSPNEQLAEELAIATTEGGKHWRRLKTYAERLNGTRETGPKITMPTDKGGIAEILPEILSWSRRFFDHGGIPDCKPTSSGWLAAAYPIRTSPAYVSPDANGRLRYDHINADGWAHTFRHYLRPRCRYELLWRSLLDELRLPSALSPGNPEPEAGGIDVVLERTHPVSRPLVLSSRRLDKPVSMPPPGRTWEVIIARHREQQLDSSNQTLRRRLGYRQQAFSLTRRFTESEWSETFRNTRPPAEKTEMLPPPVNIPDTDTRKEYPELEPLECAATDSQLELALPSRLPSFQQGAMVLQWQGLPHFYEYHLSLVAQAVSRTSEATDVVHRDFEYHSPEPRMERVSDSQLVRIRLARLWDSIGASAEDAEAARLTWSADVPKIVVNERSPDQPPVQISRSALPDPGVVYQVVQEYSGNVEVQLELAAEVDGEGRYTGRFKARRLGRKYKEPARVEIVLDRTGKEWRYWLAFPLELEGDSTQGARALDARNHPPKLRSRKGSAPPSNPIEIRDPSSGDSATNGDLP